MERLMQWFLPKKKRLFDAKKAKEVDDYFIKISSLFNLLVQQDPQFMKAFQKDRNTIFYLPQVYVDSIRRIIIRMYSKSDDPISQGYMSSGNLQYALEYVIQRYNEYPREKAIIKKAAFIFYNIISKHPFSDGNKRSGVITANAFMECNGYTLGELPFRESKEFITAVAEGKKSEKDCERFIKKHARKMDISDEILKKLKEMMKK
ncbi:Fic family protein [Candidatus Woesearchaeota archaeon]|nr:Fic family protein [Candidatus Woesearchaeota archaeon]